MSRNKNSVQITPDYKILCYEINELTTVETDLPFGDDYTIYGYEFVEEDSVENVNYASDKTITAYRFEEDIPDSGE